MARDSGVTSSAVCAEKLWYRVTPSTQNVLKRKAFSATVWGFGECAGDYQALILRNDEGQWGTGQSP